MEDMMKKMKKQAYVAKDSSTHITDKYLISIM